VHDDSLKETLIPAMPDHLTQYGERPTPAVFGLPGWGPWRVFIATGATYSSYRIIQLLLAKAVMPLDPPSTAARIGFGLLDGALVGLFSVGLVALGERLPIEKPRRGRNVVIHVLAAFLCSIVTLSLLWTVGTGVAPDARRDTLIAFTVVSFTHSLFVFLAITAVVQAVIYHRRFRDREMDALRLRSQLTDAQLESLTAKLQPHFLFNTLNGISDLIFTDPKKADALVLRLAQLLRASLDSADDEISLRRELEILSAYFDIERMRFGDRLRVTIDADRASWDARVPPFLVQPLAENAIQHGIAPRASGGAVTLRARVEGTADDHRLVLELSDDGVGLHGDAREGIGLRITRQRLETLYRGAGALTVRARPGGGTVATIELPYERMAS
jgi:two-component system, LytTR family, sensor kinase